jgi:hypothetical protein
MLWEANLAVADQPVHLLRLLSVERTPSAAHLEEQYTQGPKVDVFAVSLLVEQHFRREVSAVSAFACDEWPDTYSVVPQKVLVS